MAFLIARVTRPRHVPAPASTSLTAARLLLFTVIDFAGADAVQCGPGAACCTNGIADSDGAPAMAPSTSGDGSGPGGGWVPSPPVYVKRSRAFTALVFPFAVTVTSTTPGACAGAI